MSRFRLRNKETLKLRDCAARIMTQFLGNFLQKNESYEVDASHGWYHIASKELPGGSMAARPNDKYDPQSPKHVTSGVENLSTSKRLGYPQELAVGSIPYDKADFYNSASSRYRFPAVMRLFPRPLPGLQILERAQNSTPALARVLATRFDLRAGQ